MITDAIKRQATADVSSVLTETVDKKRNAKERLSSAAKIESIYDAVDSLVSCNTLVADASLFLQSIVADANDPKKMRSHIVLAKKVPGYATSATADLLKAISKSTNNTKAKNRQSNCIES